MALLDLLQVLLHVFAHKVALPFQVKNVKAALINIFIATMVKNYYMHCEKRQTHRECSPDSAVPLSSAVHLCTFQSLFWFSNFVSSFCEKRLCQE